MFFLLRMAFWLGLVLILLPSGGPAQRIPATTDVGASDALSAASATVTDVKGFCARQPNACTIGTQIATAIGYRAQNGAKMLYELLSEMLGPRDTGSIGGGNKSARPRNSQDTLTPADLNPTWRGPPSRHEARHSGKLSG